MLRENASRRHPQRVHRLTLLASRCLHALGLGLGLAEAVTGVEQQVDLPPLPARELVDRPHRDGRLSQCLDPIRLFPVSGLAQLAGDAIALGDELAGLDGVEAVELGFEAVHGRQAQALAEAEDELRVVGHLQ